MASETIFGIHAVSAMLEQQPASIRKAFVLTGRKDKRLQSLLDQLAKLNVHCREVPRQDLDDLCEQGVHQGIAVRCVLADPHGEDYLDTLLESIEGAPFLLVLDGVTDPHNLGACLRSADAAGVHGVIVPKDKSATLTSTARKVACGAAETVPLIRVTNLARTLRELQDRGIWLVGTAGEAEQMVFQADLTGPLAVVMGAEGKGMRRLTREHCDSLIKIPMAGAVSSLNVSVATGVCLFEAVRQRALASS